MRIGTATHTRRTDAANALAARAVPLPTTIRYADEPHGLIAHVAGFDVEATSHHTPTSHDITLCLAGVPGSEHTTTRTDIATSGIGLIQRIERRAANLPTCLSEARDRLAAAEQTIADAEQRIGAPFRYADALAQAHTRLRAIDQQLAEPQPNPPGTGPSVVASDAPTRDTGRAQTDNAFEHAR